MFIARLVIYIAPLFIFPLFFRKIFKKEFLSGFTFYEFLPIGILTGLATFLLAQFILLQFFNFTPMLLFLALVIAMLVNWLLMLFVLKIFPSKENPPIIPVRQMTKMNSIILTYLLIVGTVWYLGVAIKLFYEPSFWWDEIIHWVPKAKILIESGNINEINKIPFPEYPRFWPILIADFMLLQDKLTQIIPLILYYGYWSFALVVGVKYIEPKNPRSIIPIFLLVGGAFMNIGWGAPYADLPLSVFYCTALILLYFIIDRKLSWKYVFYPAVMLGAVTQIRTEGILYSLVAIMAFTVAGIRVNKTNSLRAFVFMVFVNFIFYVSWPIYLVSHSIPNQNLEIALTGFKENWGNWSLILVKVKGIIDYMWLETGKLGRPYFLLIIFLVISTLILFKSRKPSVIFGILSVFLNFAVVFMIIIFSPILSGGFGGLIWWLQTNYTRFTGHYLPFVFFISAVFLHRLQSKKKV